MNDKLPSVSGRDMLRVLRRDGWTIRTVNGSHHQHVHPTKPGKVTVPVHGSRNLSIAVVRSIMTQASLSADDVRELL